MTYSCCDYTDDIGAELQRIGAIHGDETQNFEDDVGEQATAALAGIGRLCAIQGAAVELRRVLADLAARGNLRMPKNGALARADKKLARALRAIQPPASE